jgi:hypothetical protein
MKLKNKITKMILLAGLVITTVGLRSNTIADPSQNGIETEKTIKDYFKFPQMIIPVNESQKIEVLFTTNQNGQVDFVLAKTEQQNLKVEIEKQFLKLNLTKLKSDVVHSVVLNIKTV